MVPNTDGLADVIENLKQNRVASTVSIGTRKTARRYVILENALLLYLGGREVRS